MQVTRGPFLYVFAVVSALAGAAAFPAEAGASRRGGVDLLFARLDRLCAQFPTLDLNRDGRVEINSLKPLGIQTRAAARRRGLVLVFVEPRLLEPSQGAPDLIPSLKQYADDLADGGFDAFVISASVYAGPEHQDGRTVLALREFFIKVKHRFPEFAGAVLVGSFPEAYLVRQYNWSWHQPVTLNKGTSSERVFEEPVHLIRSRAEPVARRADIVLADLDGRWDRVYHEKKAELPYVMAAYGAEERPQGGETAEYEPGHDGFEDFYFVNDGRYHLEQLPDGRIDFRPLKRENQECSPRDLRLPNPMARPDICVSRINPRGIALRPKADVVGVDGERLLDTDGRRQTVAFASEKDVPHWLSVWESDPVLERRLLVEFFLRNHRYRKGAFADSRRPACISTEFGSAMPSLRLGLPEWSAFNEPGYEIVGEDATVVEAINWLRRPALLRAFQAHSDPWGSTFFRSEDVAAIEEAVGGMAWSWTEDKNTLRPGLNHSTSKLDFAIYRSLYENRILPDGANLFFDTGCEAISPPGAEGFPYNDERYGYWQGAEGLLFYCNGLALVGRAKVFYDEPREFVARLARGETWGEAWRHYFEVEARAADVEEVGGSIGRKRAYFWSVLGDWTIRLTTDRGP